MLKRSDREDGWCRSLIQRNLQLHRFRCVEVLDKVRPLTLGHKICENNALYLLACMKLGATGFESSKVRVDTSV